MCVATLRVIVRRVTPQNRHALGGDPSLTRFSGRGWRGDHAASAS